ncbi:LPS assembly lipoprotein LptE [Deltaproteobacteria bacterium OttesenSCG-928-K17]|nr:LPS assembly lipoprotein LptE [Deltaproteobacteria bacterium OttesenSCG-928-K17]
MAALNKTGAGKKILAGAASLALGLALLAGGCGYSLSTSPYGLAENITVGIPVVVNQSRYADIGPMLTEDIISRLDAAPGITVREGAAATLKMEIKTISISGGAWSRERNNDLPTDSASRHIYMTVEAVLERPNPNGGQPLQRRHVFNGQRNFLVGSQQEQVELRQQEAFQWLISDLGQKIAQTMFSEF